jgi:phospholipid/cholesterol/gamma-HCH transport system permease protein
MVISMMLLTIYFNFIGLIGSFFATQFFKSIRIEEYFRNLMSVLTLADIFTSLIKSITFGIIISTVASYQAFRVKVSSTELPVAVIKAVGGCTVYPNVIITLIIIYNVEIYGTFIELKEISFSED